MSLARSSPSYGTQPYPTALLDIYRSICDCIHGAATFAEAVRVRVEIRLVNRVEDGPRCALHDAVSQGGYAQRALFAIVLRYVDSPDGLRRVRLALQLVDERRHLTLVVLLERYSRHAVHALGLATRSR